jgi:hypothetical protein
MPSHSSRSSLLSTFRAPRWGAPALPSFCCCSRSATSWGLVLFSHCSASRIFIMQPGCSPPPAVTQDDDHRPRGGEERAGPWPPPYPQLQGCSSSVLGRRVHRARVRLRVGNGPLLPSVIGGEGCSPSVALAAAACLAPRPERIWRCFRCHLLPLGRSAAARPPHGCRSRLARAGHVQVLLVPSAATGGSHNTSYAARAVLVFWDSLGEDGSENLPVRFGAAAVRRCSVGGQVAAVVGAEGVVAIGEAPPCRSGCLRRRDRQCHLRPGPPALWL